MHIKDWANMSFQLHMHCMSLFDKKFDFSKLTLGVYLKNLVEDVDFESLRHYFGFSGADGQHIMCTYWEF